MSEQYELMMNAKEQYVFLLSLVTLLVIFCYEEEVHGIWQSMGSITEAFSVAKGMSSNVIPVLVGHHMHSYHVRVKIA